MVNFVCCNKNAWYNLFQKIQRLRWHFHNLVVNGHLVFFCCIWSFSQDISQRSSFLFSKFSQSQSVMSLVHFVIFILNFPPLKISYLFLKLATLLFNCFLFFRNRNFHLVKSSMQLKKLVLSWYRIYFRKVASSTSVVFKLKLRDKS